MKGIVQVEMFMLPNFLRVKGLDGTLSVGHCFPTDNDARRFWLEAGDAWVKHVAERRAAHSGEGGQS